MRRICFLICLYASFCVGFTSLGHASPAPADSVHFCLPLDLEEMRARDSIYAANKQALNLNVGPPRTVRMIYFLPNDRPYRASVVDSMKRTIRQIQTFYGEQMQAHGYRYNTFAFEFDASGEPIVHRVDGQYPDSHYLDNTVATVTGEVRSAFDLTINVYILIIDNSITAIGSNGRHTGGGGLSIGKTGGFAIVHEQFSFYTVAHELGHAFGLTHDFRNDAYIMSYGLGRSQLSDCNAKLLAVHPYFNSDVPLGEGLPPDLEVISGRGFQKGSKTVTIQTRVSDVGGLHQVLLLAETRAPHIAEGFDEVISCEGVAGKLDAVVTFEFDGMIPSGGVQSLADSVAHPVLLRAVDNDGNAREVSFVLVEVSNNRIATLASHSSVVTSVAYSPDGETLASGSHDSMVKIWDTATRRSTATLAGHTARVTSVAFSPDGNRLASGSWDRTVKLWDLSDNRPIATLTGNQHAVISVAFSPDGGTLAVGSSGGIIKLWDVKTGNARIIDSQENPVVAVSFSPDGQEVASGHINGDVLIWDVETKQLIAFSQVHGSTVTSVAFSPNGTRVATGSYDHTVRLWDIATVKLRDIARLEQIAILPHTSEVYSVDYSTDGSLLASGSKNGLLGLWNVNAQRNIVNFRYSDAVWSVAFSPVETLLAAGSSDGSLTLWDVSKYTPSVPPSSGSNSDAILSLDLIPNGGEGNQVNDGVTLGTVSGKDTKIAVEVFASGVKTSLAGLLVKFDFDSSVLAFVKAESGAFGFNIPQATGTYFAATNNVVLPASGFLARGEFKTLVDVTNRPLSIGIDVVTLSESQTVSNDIRTTKVISFNSTTPPATFSVSLDANSAAGNQGITLLDVATGSVVPIQLFGNDIRGVNGVSARLEYDADQVGYDGFDPGSLLPNAQVLAVPATNPTAIDISVVSFGGQVAVDSGMVGSVRFRTTDGFSGTTLRLVNAEIGRGDQRESITPSDIAVTLRLAEPSPDFNGDGKVDFGDFVAFGMHFGASRGDARYEAKYDLDQDGMIGFGDFLIFGREFGSGA